MQVEGTATIERPSALPPAVPLLDPRSDRYLALVLLAAGALAGAVAILIDYLPGSTPGYGLAQRLMISAGALIMVAGGALLTPAARRLPAAPLAWVAMQLHALIRFGTVAAEVGAVVLVLRWFRIESPVFHDRIGPLVLAGFLVNHLLPLRFRLSFFALLSMAGIGTVFGVQGAAWLIGIGIGLAGVCHLPVAFGARVVLLVAAGALLAGLRAQLLPSAVPEAIWPILGSMFMFRLIVYMYELRHAREPMGVARTLSYFFLLPNVTFPLFPVVDFATFRRTYYDRDAIDIYRAGVRWMLIGLTHLLAYRIVYQYLTLPAADVASGTDLARYMVSTFLLYLKVSGQFHLIVGMLHLFGFRLPETHRFFYLASSFTDLWRRINIYWKDFMAKVFYFPMFFRIRERGDTFALVASTLFVFFSTWVLHSYQWFWLLGSVLLSWPDALFWGLLAVLLVGSSLRERKHGRKRSLGGTLPTATESLRRGAAVALTFTTMCVLWSLWSSHTLGDWFALWRRAQVGVMQVATAGAALVAVALLVATAHQVMARLQLGARPTAARPMGLPFFAVNAAWLALFAVFGSPAFVPAVGTRGQEFVRDLRVDKLNRGDAELLHRGYYENLTGVNQFNSRLWEAYAKRPSSWQAIWETEAIRPVRDFRQWEVAPLVGIVFNGSTLRTNRWGMRDGDYELVPPPQTYRIALIGASFAMGQGVHDHEVFEQVVEERLNAELGAASPERYEILNFSVPNYAPVQQLLMLEQKIFDFGPSAVFIIGHPYDTQNSPRHIARKYLDGVAMPYPFLDSIIAAAGLRQDMSLDEMTNRLREAPYKHDILRWSLARIAEACRDRGIQPVWVFVSTPEVAIPQEEIEVLIRLAGEAGFTVIDISDAYGGRAEDELRLTTWDAHPNALAHRLIADRLHHALVNEGGLSLIRSEAAAGTDRPDR
jgi:D-alanyl-lipoteichoic acid acyltransferase DltB (MBOAT superfamily)